MKSEISTIEQVYAPIFEYSLLQEIEKRSVLVTAAAGQSLMKTGQPITAVSMILSGTVKVTHENEEGQELLLYYVRAGEGCAMTFSCGLMSRASIVKVTAEEDLSMLCVSIAAMEEWLQKYSSWKKFVMSTIVNRFLDVIKSVDDVIFKKMDERLVHYLKQRSSLSGSSLINLTHQQIADELGTNRVVVSRLLKKLENDKHLLLYRNQIKLLKDL
jgi:CRP/FNR family transcriptional regulator